MSYLSEYKRLEGESDEALIVRICNQKDIIGSWDDVCKILNDITGYNYRPNTYRNKFQSYNKMFNGTLDRTNASLLDEIKEQRRELEKEKIKFRDERNEYNRTIRQEARKESYLDLVKRTLIECAPKGLSYTPDNTYTSDTDMVLLVSDLHCGIEVKHWLNLFNEDVLAERFKKCLNKVIQIQDRHCSENINVILSEVVSGLIHENLRCENNQNIIEQFLTVSKMICDFITELSKHFNKVNVYVAPGNHSRIVAKKEASLKGENLDNLLIPYIGAVLQNVENVYCCENTVDESVVMFAVKHNTVFAVHGDKHTPQNVVQKLTMQYGVCPKFVYLGHRHTNSMETVYKTKVISAGCWSGVDNYAIDKGFNTSPETVLSVIDENGLVCNYDINLT